MRYTRVLVLLLLVAVLAISGCVTLETSSGGSAAEYPTKPITMMVPFRAGGGTDTQARVVAVTLEEELGQPINVINNPGAGGTVGVQELLASDPDGHTIAFIVTVAAIDNPILQELDYNVDSLAVAAMMSTFQSAVVTRADAPYDNWEGFLAHAKENPGQKYMYFGASSRAVMETIAEAEELELEYVPGQGGADLGPALFTGDIDFGFSGGIHSRFMGGDNPAESMKVLLNMNSTGPLMATPDAQAAFELYGTAVDVQGAIVAPAGIPEGALEALAAAAQVAAESDAYAEVMAQLQFPITYMNAADAQAELASQYERFAANQ